MNILRKKQVFDKNEKDVDIGKSFVEIEFRLKKVLTKLENGDFISQGEIYLIKRHIQEIRELLTRDNV
jgi:hypothetical protein